MENSSHHMRFELRPGYDDQKTLESLLRPAVSKDRTAREHLEEVTEPDAQPTDEHRRRTRPASDQTRPEENTSRALVEEDADGDTSHRASVVAYGFDDANPRDRPGYATACRWPTAPTSRRSQPRRPSQSTADRHPPFSNPGTAPRPGSGDRDEATRPATASQSATPRDRPPRDGAARRRRRRRVAYWRRSGRRRSILRPMPTTEYDALLDLIAAHPGADRDEIHDPRATPIAPMLTLHVDDLPLDDAASSRTRRKRTSTTRHVPSVRPLWRTIVR